MNETSEKASIPRPGAWMSKTKYAKRAHYIYADTGMSACAADRGPENRPMGECLRSAFTSELRPTDHLCGLCQKHVPTQCYCSKCRVGKKTPAKKGPR